MSGVWERMIVVTKSISDALFGELHDLTHEVISTFLAEVCTITNSRPLVEISTDLDDPVPLSLSMFLTQKPNPMVVTNVICDYKDISCSMEKSTNSCGHVLEEVEN